MNPPARCAYARFFDALPLVVGFPATPRHAHKRLLRSLAFPHGPAGSGSLHVSRWLGELSPVVPTDVADTDVRVRDDAFVYEAAAPGEVHWHVNFADPDVFAFHGGPLFAQDELQVAEHPALASLRDVLIDEHLSTSTLERGLATPILVAGVERRIAVDLSPRPGALTGLYGNAFARASEDAVRAATTTLSPPTVSNIVAMSALPGGSGRYSPDQIAFSLATAVTAFSAARWVTRALHGDDARVVVHSGFWGCGAFGGHRVLMPALQVVAARAAGVDRLDLHALGVGGVRVMTEGVAVGRALGDGVDLRAVVDAADARAFEWGVSDGN